MNRKEINEMMKKNPSVVKSESTAEKWMGGACFVLFLVLLCFL